MTQFYNDKEELISVTIVPAGPCPVTQIKTAERDGYSAVQVAYDEVPERKVNKPMAGHLAKAKVAPHRLLREFQIDGDPVEVGHVLAVSQFEIGDKVKVTGKSKGKGFAGVVKRFHFRGKGATHGTPDRERHGGSIGQGTDPGKVWKGKKMPGHMGARRGTTGSLQVVRIDAERNLLFLKGAVPGSPAGYITIIK